MIILAWKELFLDELDAALLGAGLSEEVRISGGGVDLLVVAAGLLALIDPVSALSAMAAVAAAEVLADVEEASGSTRFSCLNLSSSLDWERSWSSSGRSACILRGSGSITYLTFAPPAGDVDDDGVLLGEGGGARFARAAVVDGVAGVISIVLPDADVIFSGLDEFAPAPDPCFAAVLLLDVLEYELELPFTLRLYFFIFRNLFCLTYFFLFWNKTKIN